MIRPNRTDALLVLDRLHNVSVELHNELIARDPEGRSLSLGVCMFVGIVLATIPLEHREEFCEGALGYSFQADEILAEVKKGGAA